MHLHRALKFSVWTTACRSGSSKKLTPGGPASGALLAWVPVHGMGRKRDHRHGTSPACSGETGDGALDRSVLGTSQDREDSARL